MKNDSALFRDRKVTSSSRRNDIDFDLSARFNTSASILNNNLEGSNHSELKKIIISLQKTLKEERDKTAEAQDKLQKHIQRANKREQQFHSILANSNSSVYMQVSGDTNIQKMYEKVIGKVAQSEQKMREKFQLRYKENLSIMERKIQGIVQLMQAQLQKAANLSEMEHKELKTNINRLEAVALQIDTSNTLLIKTNADLEFKIKLLKQEKNLLIQELNDKKNKCKKYYSRAQMNSRQETRPQSQAGYDRSQVFSREKSEVKRDRTDVLLSLKNSKAIKKVQQNFNNDSSNFALELIQSKILTEEGTLTNNLKSSAANGASTKLPLRKEYISTMTIGSVNPELQAKIMTETSRNHRSTKKTPYLLGKGNSYQSTLMNSTIKGMDDPKQSHPMTAHGIQGQTGAESNTISSLRNIINRERQRKSEFQSKLAEVQQKIIAIDKIVVDSLILIKQRQEQEQSKVLSNQIFKKTSHKTLEQEEKGLLNDKSEMVWLRSVCDKIKNIISGNGEQGLAITIDKGITIQPTSINNSRAKPKHPMYVGEDQINEDLNGQPETGRQKGFTNEELLELLQAV